jgi:hypothetical protein
MPYYIYQITHSTAAVVKNLQLVNQYDNYKQAKSEIRKLRTGREQDPVLKIIFAESELEAEALLQESREKPVLMEWEK